MTKTERIIKHLKLKGLIEQSSRSQKYRQFINPDTGKLYFIGKAGAVRTGKSSSNSISISHLFRNI